MKKILVTALGTMNSTTIVSELRRAHESLYIIGADINPRQSIANSKDVDEFYQFPSVVDDRDGYVDYVLDFCKEHRVDYVFCVIDEEVEAFAKRRDSFEAIDVVLCLANTEAIVTCHNKDQFAVWAERNIPDYCIKRFKKFSDVTDEDFPVFVKPIEGRASMGCKAIYSPSELVAYKSAWSDYVVQEFIDGKIIAVDIVSNQKYSQIEIAQRVELLRNSNGCGIAVEIVNNKEIRKACFEIADKLQLNGVVNAEFFMYKNTPKIIEVNPRLPAGIAYSCMAGLDVVMNAFRIANGEPCKFNPIKIGSHYAKRYETVELY